MKKMIFILALIVASISGMAQGTHGGRIQEFAGGSHTSGMIEQVQMATGGSGTSGLLEGGNNGHGVKFDGGGVRNGLITDALSDKTSYFGGHGDPVGH